MTTNTLIPLWNVTPSTTPAISFYDPSWTSLPVHRMDEDEFVVDPGERDDND